MKHKRKFNQFFVNPMRESSDEFHDDFKVVDKRHDTHVDTRIRIAKRLAIRSQWKTQLEWLLSKGDDVFTHLVEDYKKNELQPYHYALICLSPKKYTRSWIQFATDEIIPKLNDREKHYFIIKLLIALREHMTKKQVDTLVDIIIDNLNGTGAALLNYYFPDLVKGDREKHITIVLFEIKNVEKVISDFEKRTATFFMELYKLI